MKAAQGIPGLLLAGFAVLLPAGCATSGDRLQAAETLAGQLCRLAPTVAADEAVLTASAAIEYPLELARTYRVIPPAAFNNVLINLGIHGRGLCFQWADDLTVKLMTLHLRTLELHRGVANLDTRHEHSCVVLTGIGQAFTNGMVLDAWRHCGRLTWSPVTADQFKWKEVELVPAYRAELDQAAKELEFPGK